MEKAYVIVYKGNVENLTNSLMAIGINRFIILNDQIASVYLPPIIREEILFTIPEISWWQRSDAMSSLIQLSSDTLGGDTAKSASGAEYFETNPYINVTGKNVIIAIIDSGIDYLHPDFINPDGTSKIISIWDQNNNNGKHPEGYLFGTEISREEINNAIKNNDPSLTVDEIGTGTIAAGIAAGRGNLIPSFSGVAVDSELVVIKLKEYKDRFMLGKTNYESADFLAAIKYIEDIYVRENRKKNVVINLTVGKGSVSAIEASFLNTFTYLRDSGVIIVSGAGNEGNTDIHYRGTISESERYQDISMQVGEQLNLEIYIYVNGPDKIRVQLISPSGEISYTAVYAPDTYVYRSKFNLENTSYEMQFVYPWIETGSQKLYMYLYDIKPGVWTLRLTPEFIINGLYDIYLPNKNLISEITRFIDPWSTQTITSYGVIENAITVGGYNHKTDSMWIGSSKGPVNNWRIKPDIVAPAVDIIGPYNNQSYNKGVGTGISASITSGVVALLMEYITKQTPNSRRSLYTQVMKTYLMLGATKPLIYDFPNIVQGYGMLNLKETMRQISDILD